MAKQNSQTLTQDHLQHYIIPSPLIPSLHRIDPPTQSIWILTGEYQQIIRKRDSSPSREEVIWTPCAVINQSTNHCRLTWKSRVRGIGKKGVFDV
jgi:hypothetical protein